MSAAEAARSHLGIGEVLAALRPDFPEVTISKIRFLEAAGLVEPARTPAGYRKFSSRDIERLRYVLTAQRDQYLPLKVIKDQLASIDAGSDAVHGPAAPELDLGPSDVRLGREQMLAETGMSPAELTALDASGLLARRRGGYYNGDDVEIATIVAEISRSGLEPRHLRSFKGAADREVGLIEAATQVGAGSSVRRGDELGRARAHQAATELAGRLLRLHTALLRAGLRHTLTS